MTRAPKLAALLLALSACTEPAVLQGKVTDVWGKPVEGATVQLEGVVGQVTTDAQGAFRFEEPPAGEHRLMGGKDGYVRNVVTVAIPEERDAEMPSPVIELYPAPDQPGFFAVNQSSFDHLEARPLKTVGTELEATTGLPDIGKVVLTGPDRKKEFIFRSTLRASELSRLDLQLHRLEFVPEGEVPGVTGPEKIEVDMYVAKEAVPFDLKALPTDDVYLIRVRRPLEPGVYAFHTQGLLTSTALDALDKVPKEMAVAYPFEVK